MTPLLHGGHRSIATVILLPSEIDVRRPAECGQAKPEAGDRQPSGAERAEVEFAHTSILSGSTERPAPSARSRRTERIVAATAVKQEIGATGLQRRSHCRKRHRTRRQRGAPLRERVVAWQQVDSHSTLAGRPRQKLPSCEAEAPPRASGFGGPAARQAHLRMDRRHPHLHRGSGRLTEMRGSRAGQLSWLSLPCHARSRVAVD